MSSVGSDRGEWSTVMVRLRPTFGGVIEAALRYYDVGHEDQVMACNMVLQARAPVLHHVASSAARQMAGKATVPPSCNGVMGGRSELVAPTGRADSGSGATKHAPPIRLQAVILSPLVWQPTKGGHAAAPFRRRPVF